MAKKRLTGQVVSDKMKNTVVVEVERIKEHPKYKRRYKVHKKYKAHDQNQECKIGDRVVIEECRPISKEKRWRVIEKMPGRVEAEENGLSPKNELSPEMDLSLEKELSLEEKGKEEGDNKPR